MSSGESDEVLEPGTAALAISLLKLGQLRLVDKHSERVSVIIQDLLIRSFFVGIVLTSKRHYENKQGESQNGRLSDSTQHYRVSYVYSQRYQPLPNASISMKSDLYCIHRATFETGRELRAKK